MVNYLKKLIVVINALRVYPHYLFYLSYRGGGTSKRRFSKI